MTLSHLSPSNNHSSDQPLIAPPATATSFLSFSPSPPAPARTQSLAPPIDLTSPLSAVSTTSSDLGKELALSPDCSTKNFSWENPFLAILIAQRAQSGPSPSPTPSSASSLSHSHSNPSPTSSTASSLGPTSERSESEKREERDSVVIYDGSSLHSGDISSVLDGMISQEMKEWEEDTGSSWEEELYSTLEETNLEGSSSPPSTPIVSITPSSSPPPPIDETPRARPVNPKIHNSPSPRRKSVFIASSPRSRTHSTRSSPRALRSPTSSSISTSRQVSLLPIDAFSQNPTSPIQFSTTSTRRSHTSHPFVTSTSTLSLQKPKSKLKSKKSKKPPRSPPHLRPIRKTAEGFDADALDQFFGIPQERRRKNLLIMEGEEEEWRKIEEFRGLLEEGNRFETEPDEEEEEVLHIRAPSTRTRVARRKEKYRPPPLNLGIHTNSSASQSQPSSFSPDSATLDTVIRPAPSTLVDPLLKEIERRRNAAKDGNRVLRGKKSVGERLRGLCGIAV